MKKIQKESILFEIKDKLRIQMPILSERYHVEALSIFGSYIHNKQQVGSDIDILVEFREPPGLIKYIELENYLTDLLGIKVDLVMQSALKPRIGKRILSEVVQI